MDNILTNYDLLKKYAKDLHRTVKYLEENKSFISDGEKKIHVQSCEILIHKIIILLSDIDE